MTTRPKGSSWNWQDNVGYICITDSPYFAVGDDATDNTAAFTAALATGKPVFVPPGTYRLGNPTFVSGAIIFGTGPASILKTKAAANTGLFQLAGLTNCQIFDIALDGNKGAQTGVIAHGILVNGGSGHVIRDISITNPLADAINITGNATDIRVAQAILSGYVKSGVTVENASRISLSEVEANSSDGAAFPGDGFAIAAVAAGSSIVSIQLTACRARANAGRGFAFVGNGSKNVSSVVATGLIAESNVSHGIHGLTAQQLIISGAIVRSNGGDGGRLEGDVINSDFIGTVADGNTGFGLREIVSGSTPNFNGFIGCKAINNVASNTITKVGASSTIVT